MTSCQQGFAAIKGSVLNDIKNTKYESAYTNNVLGAIDEQRPVLRSTYEYCESCSGASLSFESAISAIILFFRHHPRYRGLPSLLSPQRPKRSDISYCQLRQAHPNSPRHKNSGLRGNYMLPRKIPAVRQSLLDQAGS